MIPLLGLLIAGDLYAAKKNREEKNDAYTSSVERLVSWARRHGLA
ncbi:MAG: hypothetical protein ABWW69_03630 [Pyrodictiaceae archaeon]